MHPQLNSDTTINKISKNLNPATLLLPITTQKRYRDTSDCTIENPCDVIGHLV